MADHAGSTRSTSTSISPTGSRPSTSPRTPTPGSRSARPTGRDASPTSSTATRGDRSTGCGSPASDGDGGRLGAGRPALAGQPGDGRRARGRAPGRPAAWRSAAGCSTRRWRFAAGQGRTAIHSGAFVGTDGGGFLERRGFSAEGQHVYAIRRLDLHSGRAGTGCTTRPRLRRPTTSWSTSSVPLPTTLLDGMVSLHEALNDAPADEGTEPYGVGRRPGPVVRRADDAAPADDVPRAGAARPDRRLGRHEPAVRRRVLAVRRRPRRTPAWCGRIAGTGSGC